MMMAITLAIFLALIGLELYFGKRLGLKVYRFSDTASHLTIGLGQQITNFALMGFLAAAYAAIQSRIGILHFDETAKLQWVTVLLIADFTYYFAHRLGHRVNLFIIPHSVHHQAKDYNYASALRLPWANRVIMFVFYVPLAILGIPPKMMLSAFIANLLVGTFAHNGVIRRKLGVLEYFLVTPRSHFVHHGTNGKYLDKNFGGVFGIWDRLFGTYQDLDEKVPVLLPGAESPDLLDPLEANLDYVRKVAFGMRHRLGWVAKVGVLFETPERLDSDLVRHGYVRHVGSAKFARPGDRVRIAVLFLASTGLSLTLLSHGASFSLPVKIGMAALVFAGSAIIGQLLGRKPLATVAASSFETKIAA
jgi:alkylglycerol monooxygenase